MYTFSGSGLENIANRVTFIFRWSETSVATTSKGNQNVRYFKFFYLWLWLWKSWTYNKSKEENGKTLHSENSVVELTKMLVLKASFINKT